MSPAGRDGGRASGMVLVEVLTALSIVAVMSGLLMGFLGQLRAIGTLEAEAAARTELSAAAGHVLRTLAAAKAAPLPGEETEGDGDGDEEGEGEEEEEEEEEGEGEEDEEVARAVFEGDAGQMHFAAVARRGFQSLALRDVRIAAVADGGGQALVQLLAPRRSSEGPAPRAERFTILDDLSGARFEYADIDGAFAAGWRSDRLPAAVRITLSRAVGGRTIFVQEVARVR